MCFYSSIWTLNTKKSHNPNLNNFLLLQLSPVPVEKHKLLWMVIRMWDLEDNVQVLVTNITKNAVAEVVVAGTNAHGKILQMLALMAFTKANGCSIVTKDIILQSNIGKAQVWIVNNNMYSSSFLRRPQKLTKSPCWFEIYFLKFNCKMSSNFCGLLRKPEL